MPAVIKIENLWKEYRLGVIGHGTLTHDLQSWWARLRGKEDPNAQITPMLTGQEKQIDGNRFWALQGINLEIKQGEILGIIGKNGAGKSTLLKILSRVTAPTRGDIKVKGRIASLLEVGTGFHPELTGRENIFLNGIILGMSKQEIKSKFDEIIDFSGVEQYIETPVKRYSSGMRVRLAFAVAAHLEPEILVIDEVLAVGDAEFQKKAMGKMDKLSSCDGRTIIVVSHNMKSIEYLCDSAIIIKTGIVDYRGTTSTAISRYLDRGDVLDCCHVIPSKIEGIIFEDLSIKTDSGKIDYGQDIQFGLKISSKIQCDIDVRFPLSNRLGNRIGTVRQVIAIKKGLSDVTIVIRKPFLSLGSYTASLNIKIFNQWAVNQEDVVQFLIVGGEESSDFDFMVERLGILGSMFNTECIVN